MKLDISPPQAISLSGLWVAAIGFFVTRFTVTLAAFDHPTQFLLGGITPLVLGLSLSALGMALVVGSFDPAYVRTIAIWCTIGTISMLVLVVITILGSSPDGLQAFDSIRSRVYLSNFLIGGSIGGTLTGMYAAQNETHRSDLKQQANRLVTLNRILRHEVLNAITVVQGTLSSLSGSTSPSPDAINQAEVKSQHIVETINDIKFLTQATPDERILQSVNLEEILNDSLVAAKEKFPNANFTSTNPDLSGVSVQADNNLSTVLLHLLDNAAQYTGEETPTVEIETVVTNDFVCIQIKDNGPGLPEMQQAVLEDGEITDIDDPRSGFGTNYVRLFVEHYGGEITTSVTEEGSVIQVDLLRADRNRFLSSNPLNVRSYGVNRRNLVLATVASLLAGGVMGLFLQSVSGIVPVIGALYGVPNPLVGWITHEFHSIVFGLIFACFLVVMPDQYSNRFTGRFVVGLAWGLVLWLIAAGVIMPAWLTLVGIPSSIPSISPIGLVSHTIWGGSLAVFYHIGDRWLN